MLIINRMNVLVGHGNLKRFLQGSF